MSCYAIILKIHSEELKCQLPSKQIGLIFFFYISGNVICAREAEVNYNASMPAI